MMMFGLVILCLVVSVERQACVSSVEWFSDLQQERKKESSQKGYVSNMYPCWHTVYTVGRTLSPMMNCLWEFIRVV